MRELLAERAVRASHVLVVEVPGSARTRVAAERAIARRGWQLATSPADADVLLTCGAPGPQLEGASNCVWDQMPGPRTRVTAQSIGDVEAALDCAKGELLDDRGQRIDAGERQTGAPDPDGPAPMDTSKGDQNDDADNMDVDDMDDMDDMDMSPGGIALADDGADTDGLDLDVLHVSLGPVLLHWPAGLVLDCTVQGDLIMEANARWIDSVDSETASDDADPQWTAAFYCDAAARLLSVAGWDAAADAARQIRDCVLDDEPFDRCSQRSRTLAARVSRHRILRWSVRGITVPDHDETDAEVVTLPARWLSAAADVLDHGAGLAPVSTFDVDELGALVTGLDLAAARMVVAGLAPRLTVMSDA